MNNTVLENKDKTNIVKPPLYIVMLHNDNTTAPSFVRHVLMCSFRLSEDDAKIKMMEAHDDGQSVVKRTTKDVAETQLLSANRHNNQAIPGLDYTLFGNTGGRCELQFTIHPESKPS